jgi:glycyl-tRNA synthetase (class II)
VREFTLAEIEHFVDPEDKSHPKFKYVKDLEFLLYPRAEQLGAEKKPVLTKIGDAVAKVGLKEGVSLWGSRIRRLSQGNDSSCKDVTDFGVYSRTSTKVCAALCMITLL